MIPVEAARLLELPDHATPDQIEARFNELRARLEDKIAKAPTPGLRAKYRENLDQMIAAFETLALAADSSALPVLAKQKTGNGGPKTEAGVVSSPREPVAPTAKSKGSAQKSGKEFMVVALIAVAVLGAGGWWVMKTRAEKAEQARIAAEAKLEADRQAEATRLAAQAQRRAEEDEKARLAAVAKAEQERLDKQAAQVRVGLAEATLEWEDAERTFHQAERRLADLRSEARSLRDDAGPARRRVVALAEVQEIHVAWLAEFLSSHPARRLRVRTEQLLSVRQVDEAAAELAALTQEMRGLGTRIAAATAEAEAALYGALEVRPDDTVRGWVVEDAFGQRFEGTGSHILERVAAGEATITANNGRRTASSRWMVPSQKQAQAALSMPDAMVFLTVTTPGAEAWQNGRRLGPLPLRLADLAPGPFQVEIRAEGFLDQTVRVNLEAGRTAELTVVLEPRIPTEQEIIQAFSSAAAGVWIRRGQGLPGTGLMRIHADSREVASKGKYMGVTNLVNMQMTVPDPRAGTIYLVDVNATNAAPPTLQISLVDGQLVLAAPDRTQRMVRGTDSDW